LGGRSRPSRDQVDVALQHGVIERLPKAAADEVGAERLEYVLEGPGAGPFSHGVADVDAPREHVRDDHVVGVGAVVHEVHDDVVAWNRRQGALVLVIHAHLVQQVHEDLGEVVAEFVVRQDVEVRDDLVHVGVHRASHGGLRQFVQGHVLVHGGGDGGVDLEGCLDEAALLQLVAGQAGAEIVQGVEGGAAEAPAGEPEDCGADDRGAEDQRKPL